MVFPWIWDAQLGCVAESLDGACMRPSPLCISLPRCMLMMPTLRSIDHHLISACFINSHGHISHITSRSFASHLLFRHFHITERTLHWQEHPGLVDLFIDNNPEHIATARHKFPELDKVIKRLGQ